MQGPLTHGRTMADALEAEMVGLTGRWNFKVRYSVTMADALEAEMVGLTGRWNFKVRYSVTIANVFQLL